MSEDPDYGYSDGDPEDALRGPEPQNEFKPLIIAGLLAGVGAVICTLLMQKRIRNPTKP